MATKTTSRKKSAGKAEAALPQTARDWIEMWSSPDAIEQFHVTAHASDMQASSLKHAETITRSCVAFLGERLEKDFRTAHDLASCREPAALIRIGTEFWQTAWQDYRDFMMSMGDEITDLADDTEEVIAETSDDANKALRKMTAE